MSTQTLERFDLDTDLTSEVECADHECKSVGADKRAVAIMRHQDCMTLVCEKCTIAIEDILAEWFCLWCTTCDHDNVLLGEVWFVAL